MTTQTSLLRLILPVQGEFSGTWGDQVNAGLTNLVDSAVAGTTTLNTDADVTLTANNFASDQARAMILFCTGARTAIRSILAPNSSKVYVVQNTTSFGVTLKGVTGPTTGVTIPATTSAICAWSGTDFVVVAQNNLASNYTGVLPVANGGTGAATLTANSVLLGNGTSAVQAVAPGTSGNVLTSNGTTWASTTPATFTQTEKILSISASVAANALTITSGAQTLDFRSATLTSGTVTTVTGTPSNLVVPASATLGTVSATQSRLVVVALNNAGTIELAVVNIAGGNDLAETGLISTTAISAAATSASVVYSTTARTSVAYRVLGYIESTQATAGTWATAPSTIQGAGGQALTAMSSLGYGQTWQDVSGSRAFATTYYNTTGRPIAIHVNGNSAATGASFVLSINGASVINSSQAYGAPVNIQITGIIPPGASYSLTNNFSSITVTIWKELR
jgi:hypothetical protein